MRLTRRGIGLLLAGLALLFSGLIFGYPELTVVGCAALIAFVGAFAWALRRWTLDVHRVVEPDRVTRGESCTGVVTVFNHARWRGVDLVAFDRCGDSWVPVPVLRLAPQRETVADYALPTHRRGVIDVGPLRIERRDLLDVVRIRRDYGGTRKVWVHPVVQHLLTVPAGTARSLDGVVDRVEHGSITFHALREYVAGDDLRHVHWRTSARVGELMVREHVDTSLPRVVVLLDDRASAHLDDVTLEVATFESTVDACASVVAAALEAQLHVDLHTVSGSSLDSSTTQHSVAPFLDMLAEVDTDTDAQLRSAVDRLRHRRMGDTLIVLTGATGNADVESIAVLRGVYPSILVGVIGSERVGTGSEAGMLVIGAADAADFAKVWDGVRAW